MMIGFVAGYVVFGLAFVAFLHVSLIETQPERTGLPRSVAFVFAAFWPIVLAWYAWKIMVLSWFAWRLGLLIREHQPAGRGGDLDSTREDSPLPRWPLPRSESPVDWN